MPDKDREPIIPIITLVIFIAIMVLIRVIKWLLAIYLFG